MVTIITANGVRVLKHEREVVTPERLREIVQSSNENAPWRPRAMRGQKVSREHRVSQSRKER